MRYDELSVIKLLNYRNTDFYSSYVISLNETIFNYFVNWLLPGLFANAKVTQLYFYLLGKLNMF